MATTDQNAGLDIAKAWSKVQRCFTDDLLFANMADVFSIGKVDQTRQLDFVPLPTRITTDTALNGADRTPNEKHSTNELQVPIKMDNQLHATFTLTATDLNDPLRFKKAAMACSEQLMSDLNIRIMDEIRKYSCQYTTVAGASGTGADVNKLKALANSIGLPRDRSLALNSDDYAGLANNLNELSRSYGNSISDKALTEGGTPPNIAGFNIFDVDYTALVEGNTATGLTIDTSGANARYVPLVEVGGIYYDNRTQDVPVPAATYSGLNEGDVFTIAGIYSLHHRSRRQTAKLQPIRVVSKKGSNTLELSPPLISGKDASTISSEYQNVYLDGDGSATAPITILNTADTMDNIGWCKDSVVVTPGFNTYMPGTNSLPGYLKLKTHETAVLQLNSICT